MGRPMAKNLLKAGYDLNVYDLNKSAVEDVAACGATGCDTIKRGCKGLWDYNYNAA